MLRTNTLLIIAVMSLVSSCAKKDNCVSVGKNLLENRQLVSGLATRQKLPTTELEAANIVGAALAAAQLEFGQEGAPGVICLRQGNGDDTEFMVLSDAGKLLSGWQSLHELMSD